MKKKKEFFITSLAIMACFSLPLLSQVKYTSDNKFGIGTTSPSARLDITVGSSMQGIRLNCANYDVDLALSNGTNYGYYWRYKGTGYGNYKDLQLWTEGQVSTDVQVYNVHQDGNIGFLKKVGIGTTNPQYSLHIKEANPVALIECAENNKSYLRFTNGTNTHYGGYLQFDNGVDKFYIGTHDESGTNYLNDQRILSIDINDGYIRFYPQNTSQYHDSFITYALNPLTKNYIVKLGPYNTNFYVHGDGNVYHKGLHTISDISLKENIKDITSSLEIISQLRPVSYNFIEGAFGEKVESSTANDDKIEYGLIAQEVEQILPEIVTTRDDSLKSISYLELIPVLIGAIQTQQSQINYLTEQIKSLTEGELKSATLLSSIDSDGAEFPALSQNIPNPFDERTIIKYSIPEIISYATINVYDLKGAQVKNFKISQTGSGEVEIPAYELSPGIYIYNLIVDAKVIDTKQMILTE